MSLILKTGDERVSRLFFIAKYGGARLSTQSLRDRVGRTLWVQNQPGVHSESLSKKKQLSYRLTAVKKPLAV